MLNYSQSFQHHALNDAHPNTIRGLNSSILQKKKKKGIA